MSAEKQKESEKRKTILDGTTKSMLNLESKDTQDKKQEEEKEETDKMTERIKKASESVMFEDSPLRVLYKEKGP